MVSLHWTIPILIPIPTQIELDCIVMLRIVHSGAIPIPMHVPMAMQMGAAPKLVSKSVLIRWNLTYFHFFFTSISLSVLVPVKLFCIL